MFAKADPIGPLFKGMTRFLGALNLAPWSRSCWLTGKLMFGPCGRKERPDTRYLGSQLTRGFSVVTTRQFGRRRGCLEG